MQKNTCRSRDLVSDELIGDNLSDFTTNSDTASSVSDDEYDGDLQKPEFNSLTEAIVHTEHLRHFALYNGYEELALSISKANYLLCSLKLDAPRRQMQMEDYFKPT